MTSIPIPENWTTGNETTTAVVDVSAEMINKVQELVNSTCRTELLGGIRSHDDVKGLRVVKVERIENLSTWERYALTRSQIAARMETKSGAGRTDILSNRDWQKLDTTCNEAMLFHASKPDHVATIINRGVDERTIDVKSLLGACVPFCENSSRANDFTAPDHSNHNYCYLFLCRVALGVPMVTFTTMAGVRRLTEDVDSVRMETGAASKFYRGFGVYDGNQCYPEYLVTVERVRQMNPSSAIDDSVSIEDVTDEMREKVQEIINATCNQEYLGRGRNSHGGDHKGLKVTKVQRVHNKACRDQYDLMCKQIARRIAGKEVNRGVEAKTVRPWQKLDPACNESMLLHGIKRWATSHGGAKVDVLDKIAHQGLDERVFSPDGTLGACVPFSESSSQSDDYMRADRENDNLCYMFLCRVALGNPLVTLTSLQGRRTVDPPYDSVRLELNPNRRHRGFGVYDGNQCYPEYIITIERVSTPNPQ